MPAEGQRPLRKADKSGTTRTKPNANRVENPIGKARKPSKPKKVSKLAVVKNKPTYDEMGYEIDLAKVARAMRRPRKLSPDSYMKMLDDEIMEDNRKAEIMGTPREQVSAMTMMAWEDRVARELGKPFHKVVMDDFEEIYRRGIKFHPDEFVAAKMSEEEMEHISKLATGSIFRK